jgi:hypothetical protein
MSYILSPEQREALHVPPEELTKLSSQEKIDYNLRYHEIKATKREAFWNAVSAFATAGIPLLVFFGFSNSRKQ